MARNGENHTTVLKQLMQDVDHMEVVIGAEALGFIQQRKKNGHGDNKRKI